MEGVISLGRPNLPDWYFRLSIVRHIESSLREKNISMGIQRLGPRFLLHRVSTTKHFFCFDIEFQIASLVIIIRKDKAINIGIFIFKVFQPKYITERAIILNSQIISYRKVMFKGQRIFIKNWITCFCIVSDSYVLNSIPWALPRKHKKLNNVMKHPMYLILIFKSCSAYFINQANI